MVANNIIFMINFSVNQNLRQCYEFLSQKATYVRLSVIECLCHPVISSISVNILSCSNATDVCYICSQVHLNARTINKIALVVTLLSITYKKLLFEFEI